MSNREIISKEVHRILEQKLPRYTRLTQWIEGHTESEINAAIAKAQEIRSWAENELEGLIRSEYVGWIRDYYLPGYRGALQELRTGATKRRHEEIDAKREKLAVELQRIRGTVPTPP